MDKLIDQIINDEQLHKAFYEIQMPRSALALKKFVIAQHDTIEKQYEQCVLELQIAYDNFQIGMRKLKIAEIELSEMPDETEKQRLKREIKEIEIEQLKRALLGAYREMITLYEYWKTFEKKYTYEELQAAQEEYWKRRLSRQACNDLLATGRITQGNLDAIRQLGNIDQVIEYIQNDFLANRLIQEGKDEIRKIQAS